MKELRDKITCWLVLKLGFKYELYLGKNCNDQHVFMEHKSLCGFPKETGRIIKYNDIMVIRGQAHGFREI